MRGNCDNGGHHLDRIFYGSLCFIDDKLCGNWFITLNDFLKLTFVFRNHCRYFNHRFLIMEYISLKYVKFNFFLLFYIYLIFLISHWLSSSSQLFRPVILGHCCLIYSNPCPSLLMALMKFSIKTILYPTVLTKIL